MNAVTEDPEREEVSLAFNRDATETVIPPDILEDVELRQGEPYQRGVECEVANGRPDSQLEKAQVQGCG